MNQLKPEEYPTIYQPYIQTVVAENVLDELKEQLHTFPTFIRQIPEEKGTYAYAEDKWSIKQVLCHILDTERIMAYRALRFSRNDMTALASFDPEKFVYHARHNERSFEEIIEEFDYIRKSNLILFQTFTDHELSRKGMASDRLISVHAYLYIIAGHLNHHRIILQERYLK